MISTTGGPASGRAACSILRRGSHVDCRKGDGAQGSVLATEIATCRDCDRLSTYLDGFGAEQNRIDPGQAYWARPVPGFGDLNAELLILGLAPGAHGANRTGRPFTGDAAGELLYGALHRFGYCNRPTATSREDGLSLRNVYITNSVKCAPPGNRPTGPEKRACLNWLASEVEVLDRVRVVMAMGKDAFESYLRMRREAGRSIRMKDHRFVHGQTYDLPNTRSRLLATYHFSRYNVNTRLLTVGMVDDLFGRIGSLLNESA